MLTLPQDPSQNREIIINAIRASRHGLTVREAREQLPTGRHVTQKMIRTTLDALVEDEVLDYEQPDGEVKVYFLIGHPPRGIVRIVPAKDAPPVKLARRMTWASPLGVLQ